MSAGPGHIMRTIMGAISANARHAFTVEDLCERVFPAVAVEKKHRVAIIRALKRLEQVHPEELILAFAHWRGRAAGRPRIVVFHLANLDAAIQHLRDRSIWIRGDWDSFYAIQDRHDMALTGVR
jgi:hypothetical protein